MLVLETHLEGVFAVNLGEVVGDLEGGADFIRGQEGVAAQSLQTVDSEGRKSAIFVFLRDVLNAETGAGRSLRSLADGETRVV